MVALKLHTAVARALRDQGTDTMFGVMGNSNMKYLSEFADQYGGRYVAAKHEAGAVGMADGYARSTGRVGLATVTHGPGLTNGITALVEASRARTPMVLLASEVPSGRRHNVQWIDLPGVVAPTGAVLQAVRRPEHVVDDIGRAFLRASTARRPVVLDIPYDLLEATVDYRPSRLGAAPPARSGPDPRALDAALGVLLSADRPLLLAGRGAVRSGARVSLVALADRVGAPLATTVPARGLFAGHPLDIGLCGPISSRAGGSGR